MDRSRLRTRILVLIACTFLGVGIAGPAPATAPSPPPTGTKPVVVSSDVVSPLQLAAGPGGHEIYVGDSFAGAIKRIDVARSSTSTVTIADDVGSPNGIALRGQTVYVVGSLEGAEEQAPTYFGRIGRDGDLEVLVDLLAFERAHNPDGQPVEPNDAESNPYDVIAYQGGFIVADAAANALIRISANGTPSVLTVLPLITTGPCAGAENNGSFVGCDPVPTGLALGPDGLLYVSGLGAETLGQVWVVNPRTGVIVDNLTSHYPEAPPLTDIAVGDDGSVYASSLFAEEVYRVRNGTLSAASVPAPTGLLWMRGTLYVGSVPLLFAPEGTFAPGRVYAVPAGAFAPIPT